MVKDVDAQAEAIRRLKRDLLRVTDLSRTIKQSGRLFSRRVIGPSRGLKANRCRAMDGRLAAKVQEQGLCAFPLSPMLRIACRATDQASQFTRYEWQAFLEQHNLAQSMSRPGNCWDNAVAESFFTLLVQYWLDGNAYSVVRVRSALMQHDKRALQDGGISMRDEAREIILPNDVPIHRMGSAHPKPAESRPAANAAKGTRCPKMRI